MTPAPAHPARLVLLPDAPAPDGSPRVALALPARDGRPRPTMILFRNLSAALAAKRQMEAAR